ncbi:uncharacterized protein LOC135355535 [Latimeria chalumnae]|uniref:uncharacterized protein LOC135355535 n=1 Tax=Latimeria chalumnae TaxID=7897 RepID=UPI00313C3A6D
MTESTQTVIAAVLGSVASVLLLALLVFCCSKKIKASKSKVKPFYSSQMEEVNRQERVPPQCRPRHIHPLCIPEENESQLSAFEEDIKTSVKSKNRASSSSMQTGKTSSELESSASNCSLSKNQNVTVDDIDLGRNNSTGRKYNPSFLPCDQSSVPGNLEFQQLCVKDLYAWSESQLMPRYWDENEADVDKSAMLGLKEESRLLHCQEMCDEINSIWHQMENILEKESDVFCFMSSEQEALTAQLQIEGSEKGLSKC